MQPLAPPPMPSGAPPVYYPTVNIVHGQHPNGPEYRSAQSISTMFSLNFAHNLTQFCLGGVIVSSLITANRLDWLYFHIVINHIILCTVGYFILITQAILSFSPVGWANNLQIEHKRIIHAVLQTIGSILAVAGSLIQLINSQFVLDTVHGICGLIAMILTIISCIAGLINFMFSQKPSSNYFKTVHFSLGTLTISMAFLSLILGLHNYYRAIAGDANANLAIVLTCFAFVGTIFMSLVNNFKRILDNDKTRNNMS